MAAVSTFKTIREKLGVSQEEMAAALDCSQGNVSLLDRGQTVMPDTAKKLIAFAATRGLTIGYEDVYGHVRVPKKAAAAAPSDRPTAHAKASEGARR